MAEPAVEPDPARLRAIVRDACAVARALAREHGQRQFYALGQVGSQAAACGVDEASIAWVFAVFVVRDDFEAFFAMRETPGTYAQLRTALSPAEARSPAPPMWDFGGLADEPALGDLWELLRLAATD